MARIEQESFDWKFNDKGDDGMCNINGYTLRVEKVNDKLWWWCVYNQRGEQLLVDTHLVTGKNRAIGLCEGVFIVDSITSKIKQL